MLASIAALLQGPHLPTQKPGGIFFRNQDVVGIGGYIVEFKAVERHIDG
jgi:hypothetical protein